MMLNGIEYLAINHKKKLSIKIIISVVLLFLSGILMLVFIRSGATNITGNSPKVQWIIEAELIIFGVIILMFFPKDIKTYPIKKKLIIGCLFFVIVMVLFFAFFILSAIILKSSGMG